MSLLRSVILVSARQQKGNLKYGGYKAIRQRKGSRQDKRPYVQK